MHSLLQYLSSRARFQMHRSAVRLMRSTRDRTFQVPEGRNRAAHLLADTRDSGQIELIGIERLHAMRVACASGFGCQTDTRRQEIEDFVLEIIRNGEHRGESKIANEWGLVSRAVGNEIALIAFRMKRHSLLQVRVATSLEALITHARKLGRSVFDPHVQLFSVQVRGQPEVVAVHYEHKEVCNVRIATAFERLAVADRRIRKMGRALLQHGWGVCSNPATHAHANEISRFGLSREFDADELSNALLPYVGPFVR